MAQGSNELNMLLKAKVVQIRAELDVKGSLPKIKTQIDEISKLLESKPVKLKAELDHKSSHLNTQVDNISKKLDSKYVKLKVKFDVTVKDVEQQFKDLNTKIKGSKSIAPIKIDVQIDVKGSADNIKKQLKDVHDTVTDFNKKYGKQLKEMQEKAEKARNNAKSAFGGSAGTPVPNTATIGGFNFKLYASQLKDAEHQLRTMFGGGLFSSHELKDGEGNLQGFIASLQKANGVVQKIHYQWNEDKGTFTPISQQTITNMEKALHKAKQVLANTYADIEKLKNGSGKDKLFQDFDDLEKRARHGTLTEDAVKNLQRMIKEESVLQQKIKEATEETKRQNKELLTQQKLISRITESMDKDWERSQNVNRRNQFKDLKNQLNADPKNAEKYAFELQKINKEIEKEIQKEKELQRIESKKLDYQEKIKKLKSQTSIHDRASQNTIKELEILIKSVKTGKDLYEIKKKIASVDANNRDAKELQKIENLSDKVKSKLRELNDRGLLTSKKLEEALAQVPKTALKGVKDLENQINAMDRRLSRAKEDDKRRSANGRVLVDDKAEATKLQNIVKSQDITEIQKYVEQLYKARVETIALKDRKDTLGRSVTELQVKMKGTGKTVKEYTLQMENANGVLRETARATSFNANRNLGVFEQLKIAMARVPVWMASMTTFYGTIHTLQNFTHEILTTDKALTELKRVASSNINIETVFEGAIDLSKELGNNIHDVMQSINDLARTYGDFNERQLLAVAKTATLMSNVSDLTAQEATETLVGTMNAFNIEASESIRIVDALNEVDNNYAISTKQLAQGLQKSSSTARTFGVEMEDNISHITAIGAVTMESGAIIGNSLKTIYSRLTTINEAKGALEEINIGLYQIGKSGQKEIKPVNRILGELAGKWGTLSEEQKQNLAVTIAGRYQLSRFLALMNNWDTVTKANQTALSSQGSAMRENARYMESFEARINKLKNSFTELSLSIGNKVLSGSLLVLIEGLSSLAEVAVSVIDKFGALPIALGVVGLIMGQMGVFKGSIGSTVAMLQLMKAEFVKTSASARGFAGTMAGAGASVKAMQVMLPGLWAGIKAVGVAMRGLLISTGIGIAFVALGFAIEKLINYFAKQKAIAEKTAKANKQLVDSYRNTEGGLSSLIKKQRELQDSVDNGSIKQGTEAYNEYVEVTNKLAQKMPTIVKYIDQQGLAHLKTADAIKEQLKYAKQLSEEKATQDQDNFDANLDKQLKKYKEQQDLIAKINKEKKKLQKQNGERDIVVVHGEVIKDEVIDNKSKIQQKNIELINSEMEIQKIIQKTMGVVQNTTFAFLESKKKLDNLTDSGRTVVEMMVQQNEELFRTNKNGGKLTENEIRKNAEQILEVSKGVGVFISDTYKNMTTGIEDPLQLEEMKGNLDSLITALPDTFFKAESIDDIDKVKEKFEGVMAIAKQIETGSGDFSGLTDSLVAVGFTSDEAKRYVTKLGLQYDNQIIKTKALQQAQAEGNETLAEYVDTAIKAIDVSEQLFGVTDDDTNAIKSHIENIQQLKLVYGENVDKVQSYKDSLEAISLFTGLPEDVIAKDTNYLRNVVDLVGKASLKYDDATGALIGFNKEGLNKNQINMLNQIVNVGKEGGATFDLFTGKITRLSDGVQLVFDKEGKLVEKIKEANKELEKSPVAHGQQQVIEEIGQSADETKAKIATMRKEALFNEGDTSADKIKDKAKGVSTTLEEIQKKAYELKQQQIFGDEPKAETTKKAIQGVGESAEIAKQKLDNYKRKQAEIFNEQPKTDGTKSKINDLAEAIKKATNSTELLNKLNSMVGQSTAKLGELLSKVKSVSNGIGGISQKSSSISSSVKAIASAYESLTSKSSTASTKVKQAIDNQKKALTGLKKASTDAKTSINQSFTSMADTVNKKTSAMINKHNAQKSAINNLRDASNRAKTAINELNSSMDSAIGSLDRYISRAQTARATGNSVPSSNSFEVSSLTVPNINGLTGGIGYGGESFASAMSTMASIGSGSYGGDSGTSGTLVPQKPTFIGYRTLEGTFEASAVKQYNLRDYGGSSSSSSSSTTKKSTSSTTSSSKKATQERTQQSKEVQKENLAEAYTYNVLERAVNAYDLQINLANASLENIGKNQTKYRDGLKKIIALEISKMATMKKDLAQTEARNKSIQAQLKKLPAVSKQNASQREQYNKLMQEYDTNLNKIGSLKQEIASLANDIKQQSLDIFNDFVEQVVGAYDRAITSISNKIDDIDFNIQVLELTDPNNKKGLMEGLNKKAQESKNAEIKATEKVNALNKVYQDEAKAQGIINAKEEKAALDAEKSKQAKLNKAREDAIKKARAKYEADVKKYGAKSSQAKSSKSALDKLVADDKSKDTAGANLIKSLQKKYDDALKSGANSKTALIAKEALDKAKEELEDARIQTLQAEKEIRDTRLEIANEGIEALKDYYKQQKDMAVDAIDKQIELEQKAHEKKMEQYDEEVNGINAIYDARFKKMDEQKEKENYEEELADKNSQKAELVNKIALLSRDTSPEGRKRVAELQAQLKEINEEISDFQEDRADQVLRDSLTQQKEDTITSINGGYDENGNKIEGTREKDQALFDQQIANLEKQKEEVSKYYDDLVNNETHWQQIRDEAIKGSFTLLNTEMTTMNTNIQNMQKGIFNGLFAGFSTLSAEVKKYVAEVNSINVDNLDLETKNAIDDVKEMTKTTQYTPPTTTTTSQTVLPAVTTPAKTTTSTTTTTKPTTTTTTTTQPKQEPRYYTVKSGDTLSEIALKYYKDANKWTKIAQANGNLDPKKLKVGQRLLIPFRSGGYTGDWVGDDGRLAVLHKKELVLNERQTSDILDVAKIMDKAKNLIPNLKRNILASEFAEAGMNNITNNNYNLTVNIDTLTGDKKGADTVVKEIMKGLKKRGK